MTPAATPLTAQERVATIDWSAVELYEPEHPTAQDKITLAWLVDDVLMKFGDALLEQPLFPYQRRLTRRIVYSIVANDGETITGLQARQSGKTQAVAAAIAIVVIMLPLLAPYYPRYLAKFRKGVLVGVFAPVGEQADTMFNRVKSYLYTETARKIFADPEVSVVPEKRGGGHEITFVGSESLIRKQTAHPKASIESKTYHVLVLDEAQDVDRTVVEKSITPMGAFTNATTVMVGTPAFKKGLFYYQIRDNKREQTRRYASQLHFEADWKEVVKHNKDYGRHIRETRKKQGADSDIFKMAYELRWLTEQGMLIGDDEFDALGDRRMKMLESYVGMPVIMGVDPARKQDNTVLTITWADVAHPDPHGRYEHRVLAQKILPTGMRWHEQYLEIVAFARGFNVTKVIVDGQGMGDVVADALQQLMPGTEVIPLDSTLPEQSKRAKYLITLLDERLLSWPAHAETRRMRTYQRFRDEMLATQKDHKQGHVVLFVPESEGHDDMVDSLQLSCYGWAEEQGGQSWTSENRIVGRSAA